MYERLARDRDAGKTVCLVNPSHPSESLLDRTFRPGVLAFQLAFMIVFGTVAVTIMSMHLLTREPRLVRGRLLVDSDSRAWRGTALAVLLYHLYLILLTLPVSIYLIATGNAYGWVPVCIGAIPVAVVFLAGRYLIQHSRPGRLLLPATADAREHATLWLQRMWPGNGEFESRWKILGEVDDDRSGIEAEVSDSLSIEFNQAEHSDGPLEIDIPLPEIPPTQGRDATLQVIGRVGDQGYRDEFTINPQTMNAWIGAAAITDQAAIRSGIDSGRLSCVIASTVLFVAPR